MFDGSRSFNLIMSILVVAIAIAMFVAIFAATRRGPCRDHQTATMDCPSGSGLVSRYKEGETQFWCVCVGGGNGD